MADGKQSERGLDLGDVLRELGHTPESFARSIDRNPSGIRRMIRGEHMINRHTARDVVEGLFMEGFRDDPLRIEQLRNTPRQVVEEAKHIARRRRQEMYGQLPPSNALASGSDPMVAALANLLQGLGRKEVDRVYMRVFGVSPGSPYDKD